MTSPAGLAPWLGIAVAAMAFGLLVAGLRLVGPAVTPESRRKLFHVGGGLIALFLPWLLPARWCVVVLVATTIAVLFALRVVPAWRENFAASLHSVGRRSYGEFYFCVGVLLLFLVAPHGGTRYQIPIVILTLADPAAAVVGIRWGRHHLARWAGGKTLEGSLACLVTSLVVSVTLLALAGYQAPTTVVVALALAVAVTAAEALGSGGSDNLLIPAAAYLVLGPLLAGGAVVTVATGVAVAALAGLAFGLVAPAAFRPLAAPKAQRLRDRPGG